MAIVIDPAQAEVGALKKAVRWRGLRVLEVGCGDGRLTLRLASLGPRALEALDPDAKMIRRARRHLPLRYTRRVHYHVGHAERLKYPDKQFDVVVFSWVL